MDQFLSVFSQSRTIILVIVMAPLFFFREIPKSRYQLKLSGDMYATVMGWLHDVDAGGGTAFTHPNTEKVESLLFLTSLQTYFSEVRNQNQDNWIENSCQTTLHHKFKLLVMKRLWSISYFSNLQTLLYWSQANISSDGWLWHSSLGCWLMKAWLGLNLGCCKLCFCEKQPFLVDL